MAPSSSSVAWFFNHERFVVGIAANNDMIVLDTAHRRHTVLACADATMRAMRPFLGLVTLTMTRWTLFYQPKVARDESAALKSSLVDVDWEARVWRPVAGGTQTLLDDALCLFAYIEPPLVTFKIGHLAFVAAEHAEKQKARYETFAIDEAGACSHRWTFRGLPLFDRADRNGGLHADGAERLHFLHAHRDDYSRALSFVDLAAGRVERLYTPPPPLADRGDSGGQPLIDDATLGAAVWSRDAFFALDVAGDAAMRCDLHTREWTSVPIRFRLDQPTRDSYPIIRDGHLVVHHRLRRDDNKFRLHTQRFRIVEDDQGICEIMAENVPPAGQPLFEHAKIALTEIDNYQLYTQYKYSS